MGSIPVRVTTKERFALASRSFAIPSLDNFGKPDYNKNTRRCPPQTGTSPWWKPDGCHKHRTYRDERLAFKAVSRLFQQTAHFFLSCRYSTRDTMLAMEPKAPRTVSSVEVICIASLEIISRESKEALAQSSRAESERFFSQSRHTKRWNTLCISRFGCRRVDEKDPLSAADDWVRVSLYTRLHSARAG